MEAKADEDGLVRKVRLAIGTRDLDNNGKRRETVSHLDRPIHKLILVYETELFPD